MAVYQPSGLPKKTGNVEEDLYALYRHELKKQDELTHMFETLDDANIPSLSGLKHIHTDNVYIDSWTPVTDGAFYAYGYAYYARVTLPGCTELHTGDVVPSLQTALSGDLAPIFETCQGFVRIYSKTNNAAVIKRIEVWL